MPNEKEKSFLNQNEQLMEKWDFDKNTSLDPATLTCGSGKMAWWKCPQGHSYSQIIYKKAKVIASCPICSGHRVVAGINDFETCYPTIAKEWHPYKNAPLLPSQISKKNGIKVWWQCQHGHEWQASVHDRADGTGCPRCATRRNTSFPEQAVFFYIKQLYPDAIHRYRDIFNNGMELDVYVPSIRVGVEFDGARWHHSDEAITREKLKHQICQEHKIRLIRIREESPEPFCLTADKVYVIRPKSYRKDLVGALQAVLDYIDPSSNFWTRKNPNQIHSTVIVDIDRDFAEILKNLSSIPNSLVEKRPDLIADWHWERNGRLSPSMFVVNSNDTVWWKCHFCGHEWQTPIIARAGKNGHGCNVCSQSKRGKTFTRKCVDERGSLMDHYPELASEWHPTKNGELTPSDITWGRFKKVWWLCSACGHEWEASPLNRSSKKVGCPACSGRVPRIGENDFKTLYPQLAQEWCYEKNFALLPEQFLPKSGKKVWWKCGSCGHCWESEIRCRTNGHNCPICAKRKKT